jgi:hypothetical protein
MRRLATALVLLLVIVPGRAADLEIDRALEQRVKAAYLYRFAEFVAWPDGSFARHDAPFVIAIAGASGIASELAQVTAGRTVAGRRIDVLHTMEPTAPLASAHILFVGASERSRLPQFVRAAGSRTLIVSDVEGGLAQGSVINFVIAEGRVRFDISLDAAEKRGLKLSARLLAVAHSVRGGP